MGHATTRNSADSLIRVHGRPNAQIFANELARHCAARGDDVGRRKWQAVAAKIRKLIEAEEALAAVKRSRTQKQG